jgi:hypothetical protein
MTTTVAEGAGAASPPGMSVPFAVASRPQRRFSNVQTVSNAAGATSFAPIQLPATGWVRRISLFFTGVTNWASAGAVVNGDGPFRLVAGITVTDATGQPIMQPISGWKWYEVNKYSGRPQDSNEACPWENPMHSPEYAYSSTGTVGTATFRLDLDFEIDSFTGYGCIPNLDSNASLQVKIDAAAATAAFNGTTIGVSTLSVRLSQEYWAPVASSQGGVAVEASPPGAGDYLETRFETQTVSASSENLVTLTNRGGMIKDVIMDSRAAGVRTAITPASNLGILLDNQPINEGVPIEEHYDYTRRQFGYIGTDNPAAGVMAPLTAGTLSGLDVGVVPVSFDALSGGRTSWLNTRAGSLFQFKITPGAAATTLEIVTRLAQVKDHTSFFNSGYAA